MDFKVTIGGKEYEIPKSYTLGHWASINQWKLDDPSDWPFMCAAALKIKNPGIVMQMRQDDPKQFEFLLALVLSGIRAKTQAQNQKVAGYSMIDLEGMNLGTWMDLDILASDGKSMDKLFARLFEMPLEEAQELPLNDALPSLTLYQDWRTSVYRAYAKLFDYNVNNDEDDNTSGGSSEGSSLTPAHAWYETLMVVCDGKFENINYATQQPFRAAFNFLAWKKTKMLEERMEFERTKQKMNK